MTEIRITFNAAHDTEQYVQHAEDIAHVMRDKMCSAQIDVIDIDPRTDGEFITDDDLQAMINAAVMRERNRIADMLKDLSNEWKALAFRGTHSVTERSATLNYYASIANTVLPIREGATSLW